MMKRLLFIVLCLLLTSSSPFAEASTEYKRYIAKIFHKYGSGDTISFEGLEHLMYNLGLGKLDFQLNHSVEDHHPKTQDNRNEHQILEYIEERTIALLSNETDDFLITAPYADKSTLEGNQNENNLHTWWEFKELHDPQHIHPREKAHFLQLESSSNQCLSPKLLLRLVVDHNDLHQNKLYTNLIDNTDNHNFEAEYNNFINNMKITPSAFLKICPSLLAQLDEKTCLLEETTDHHSHEHNIWNAWFYASCAISVLSVSGLFGMLLLPLAKTVVYKKVLSFLIAVAVGTLSGDAFMHLLPHALSNIESSVDDNEQATVYLCGCAFATAFFMYIIENLIPVLRSKCCNHSRGHSHALPDNKNPREGTACENNLMLNETQDDIKEKVVALTPLAFMVVIGDGMHNFTDGLAVGAAFAADPVTGLATSIAVLAHELPHELGDFALLLQSGVQMKRAVCLNIASSVLSFLGMSIGLVLTSSHAFMTKWIYASTAGSFLYIAFADLLPAMKSEAESLNLMLLQILGFITGGLLMLTIALYEDNLQIIFK